MRAGVKKTGERTWRAFCPQCLDDAAKRSRDGAQAWANEHNADRHKLTDREALEFIRDIAVRTTTLEGRLSMRDDIKNLFECQGMWPSVNRLSDARGA